MRMRGFFFFSPLQQLPAAPAKATTTSATYLNIHRFTTS